MVEPKCLLFIDIGTQRFQQHVPEIRCTYNINPYEETSNQLYCNIDLHLQKTNLLEFGLIHRF